MLSAYAIHNPSATELIYSVRPLSSCPSSVMASPSEEVVINICKNTIWDSYLQMLSHFTFPLPQNR